MEDTVHLSERVADLEFQLDSGMTAQIHALADKLIGVPPARLFDEVLKLFPFTTD